MPTIHNRGKINGSKTVARKIIYPAGWDAEGKPLMDGKKPQSDILLPGQHKSVTDKQFAHLKELFPDEIVNVDDLKDMQAQFRSAEPEKSREGYVAPDEIEARVAARVKEELAKQGGKKVDGGTPESYDGLLKRVDGMDRGDLISIIEAHNLPVEHKNYKAPGALKAAVITALEGKQAAA